MMNATGENLFTSPCLTRDQDRGIAIRKAPSHADLNLESRTLALDLLEAEFANGAWRRQVNSKCHSGPMGETRKNLPLSQWQRQKIRGARIEQLRDCAFALSIGYHQYGARQVPSPHFSHCLRPCIGIGGGNSNDEQVWA